MAAFSQIVNAARLPAAIVQLRPEAFHSEWPHKPTNTVAVGLSLLSEADTAVCRAEASKKACELHPEGPKLDPAWVEAYNDELFVWVLSRTLCDASDAGKPYFEEHGQDEDIVKQAFTAQAIRHLWDELERATISVSPVRAPASDDDLRYLAKLLDAGAVGLLVTPQQLRMRKLAAFMLEQLEPLAEELESLDGGAEPDAEDVDVVID